MQAIISLNIGISFFLVLICYQIHKSFARVAFRYIALAWGLNSILLVINLDIRSLLQLELAQFLDIILNLTSSIYLALSFRIARSKHRNPYHIYITLICILLTIGLLFVPSDYVEIILTGVSIISVIMLAKSFYENRNMINGTEKSAINLCLIGVSVYAVIHIVPFLSLLIYRNPGSLQIYGYYGGVFSKVILIIGFFRLSMALMESKVNKGALAEELDKTIGLLFHELRPVINFFDNTIVKLLTHNDMYRLSRPARNSITQLEFESNRLKAIYDATARRYLSENFYKINFEKHLTEDQLRQFGVETSVFSINKIIESAYLVFKTLDVSIENSQLRYNESVIFNFEYGGNCFVAGYEIRLTQVFVNLFKNSYEAFKKGKGQVFVKTKVETQHLDEDKTIKVVVVEVEDSGPGIDANILERIFEEKFSTKHLNLKIKGFGLSEVKRIVEDEMSGSIRVESPVIKKKVKNDIDANPGTKFTLVFHQKEREQDFK